MVSLTVVGSLSCLGRHSEGSPRTEQIEARRELAHGHPRPEWFSGAVYIHELTEASDAPQVEVFAVFFDPRTRTLPHTHSTDQLLYFLEGEGIVATTEERRLYRSGGMAVIAANEWHWHGATLASPMCHLSIRPGGTTIWAPEVPVNGWHTSIAGVSEDG